MIENADAPGNWRSHSSMVFPEVKFPPATPVESKIDPKIASGILSFYGSDASVVVEKNDPWEIGPHLGVYANGQRIARWRPDSDTASWIIQESPEAAGRFKAHIAHP